MPHGQDIIVGHQSESNTDTTVVAQSTTTERVLVIGSGPAAWTAALYLDRAQLAPLVLEGDTATSGGQLMQTTDIENFPGFDQGIAGHELMQRMRAQAERFGARVLPVAVTSVDLACSPFRVVYASDTAGGHGQPSGPTIIEAQTIVIATGASAKRVGVRNEAALWMGGGISACATCDGALPMFRRQPVAVIGGGDSAMEEALFLTRYASKVFVVHRGPDCRRASRIMEQRARQAHPRIEFVLDTVVDEAMAGPDGRLEALVLTTRDRPDSWRLPVKGLFYAIGHAPNTAFLARQLPLDLDGYIQTVPGSTQTMVPGVFACGDVQDKRYRQAITAAGSGCMAALDVDHFLSLLPARWPTDLAPRVGGWL